MEPVRLGIIGCGVIGKLHIKASVNFPKITVEAVCDIREEAAKATAEEFNIPKYYTNADELLDDPNIQGVVLALMTAGRAEIALKAFAKGKHVLLEKPVAMNADEVRQLMQAKGNLIAGCCSSRYSCLESSGKVAEIVKSGVLGDIRVVHCRVLSPAGAKPTNTPPFWRVSRTHNGGGILANWGPYDFDYLLGITNWELKPKTVLGKVWQVAEHLKTRVFEGSDGETHATAIITCENGEVINYERGEFTSSLYEAAWRIVGEKGTLELTMTLGAPDRKLVLHTADDEKGLQSEVIWSDAESDETQMFGPIRDFAMAIAEQREPKTNLEKSLVIRQLFDAIYESSDTGKPVNIH